MRPSRTRRWARGGIELKQAFRIGDQRHAVLLLPSAAGRELVLGERRHRVALEPIGDGEFRLDVDGVAKRAWIAVCGDRIHVHVDGRSWVVEAIDELAESGAGSAGSADTAEAPMPGTVVRVLVAVGDAVKRGQTLVVIESMKMETSIVAWRDGVVATIHRPLGATFDRKAPLVTLEPAE